MTSVRWRILYLLTFVSVVRSMDAVNFSVAAKQIMPEYSLTEVQMGVLYTAFTLGYSVFHIPGGKLGIHLWANKVVGRGALLDVFQYRTQQGRPSNPLAPERYTLENAT